MWFGLGIGIKTLETKPFSPQLTLNNRVLVTLDRDFGELAIIRAIPHCGILRLVNLSTRQQPIVCLQVLELYGNELLSGAIITASLGRVRIRPKDEI